MTERRTITLTVPFHEDPVARADGALWDGRDRTGAAKDGRSIAVLHADIGKAVLAAWPGEPTGDYAKRLAEIEEWATRLGALEDEQIEDMGYEDLAAELGAAVGYVPWLLRQLRDASDALHEAQAELAARAAPNGTWAKLDALAGKVSGIADEVDSKG